MLETMLYDGWKDLVRAFLITLLAYPLLILLLRTFGKRTLTKANMFDFIVTVTYGATLASILTSSHVSLAEGAVILLMLTVLQYAASKGMMNSRRIENVLKADPSFLYREGEFYDEELQRQRLRVDDLKAKVRQQGMSSLDNVQAIVLEGDGSISVIKKDNGSTHDALEGIDNSRT
ncbi:DUF421 domain-containing protein [Indiicoccus explosivorum]|uniref:DUF421 domain-containing protein n=1 Tax=Indiicoccus explosivorum TaxID=1917864 RepID=UPI000B4485B6|nr:YetF domain-containing protein [Indiicoccus explosivorum]